MLGQPVGSSIIATNNTDGTISIIPTNNTDGVEPSGVQALKYPKPLKDVEASVVLGVVVLV